MAARVVYGQQAEDGGGLYLCFYDFIATFAKLL